VLEGLFPRESSRLAHDVAVVAGRLLSSRRTGRSPILIPWYRRRLNLAALIPVLELAKLAPNLGFQILFARKLEFVATCKNLTTLVV
jgi:hypothetical protein